MKMNHQGKNAIVTGAGSGIGFAISAELITMGYVVYGIGRTESKLNDAASQLGTSFIPVILDVSDSATVDTWFSSLDKPIDVLVNNAGLAIFGAVDDQKVEDWDTMIGVNLSGVFYMTRLATSNMKKHHINGYIINIASVAGLIGNPNLSGYNATKFGLRGFSEAIMKELRPHGIRVSCIFPGSVATPFFTDKGIETHDNMLQGQDIADSVHFLLNLPQRALVDELVMRPTSPR
jgi:NADP-dependent 3-hydroxy acid dehydrogenase YdfG